MNNYIGLFREIENAAKNLPDRYITLLGEVIESNEACKAIDFMKISGICVDIYGHNISNQLFDQSKEMLISKYGQDVNISKFLKEVEIFNKLFCDLNKLKEDHEDNNIPNEEQVAAFLLASEKILDNLSKSIERVNDDTSKIGEINRNVHLFESISKYSGSIIQYYKYKSYPFSGKDKLVGDKYINIATKHLELYDKYNKLKDLYDAWKYVGCDVMEKNNKEIEIIPQDKEEYISSNISIERFNTFKIGRIHELNRICSTLKYSSATKKCIPDQFRDEIEAMSSYLCMEMLGISNSNIQIHGVELFKWLRASTIIRNYASQIVSDRKAGDALSLANWCIIKNTDEWISILDGEGIPMADSRIIVDDLVFTRESKDMFDCPFVPFDGQLLSLPSILANTDPSQCLLSNYASKNLDLSFKGESFEDNIREILLKSKICCRRLHETDAQTGDEYETDAAFVLGNDLYMLECKSFIQPNSMHEYYHFICKVYCAAEQSNRSAKYFQDHLDSVKNTLQLERDWKPNSIHKLIITKAMLGAPLIVSDNQIIDESALLRFIKREQPGIKVGDTSYVGDDPVYNGDITNEKLLMHISNPSQISFLRKISSIVKNSLKLNEYSIDFLNYKRNVPLYNYI